MRPGSRSIHRRAAFTLYEVLLAVCLVLVLLGLLLPTVFRSRQAGLRLKCVGHAGLIVAGVQRYLQAGQNVYPTGPYDNVDWPGSVYWWNLLGPRGTLYRSSKLGVDDRLLNPYLSPGLEEAACPLDRGNFEQTESISVLAGTSYIYFDRTAAQVRAGRLMGQDQVWCLEGHRAEEVQRPDRKLVVADWVIFQSEPEDHSRTRWHGGEAGLRVSIGFADGHAAEIARKPEAARPPNVWPVATRAITPEDVRRWSGEEYY